jgi:hypothetical protein
MTAANHSNDVLRCTRSAVVELAALATTYKDVTNTQLQAAVESASGQISIRSNVNYQNQALNSRPS